MNPNYAKYAAQYQRTKLGSSSKFSLKDAPPGFSRWIEAGEIYQGRTVPLDAGGDHAYANGGYSRGQCDCVCGCFMFSSSSGGPVDPFGPCPHKLE